MVDEKWSLLRYRHLLFRGSGWFGVEAKALRCTPVTFVRQPTIDTVNGRVCIRKCQKPGEVNLYVCGTFAVGVVAMKQEFSKMRP